jgi:hypothetical protein
MSITCVNLTYWEIATTDGIRASGIQLSSLPTSLHFGEGAFCWACETAVL